MSARLMQAEKAHSRVRQHSQHQTLLDVALQRVKFESVRTQSELSEPVQPVDTISYDIPRAAFVNTSISMNVLGRRVISLVDGSQSPNHFWCSGTHPNVSSDLFPPYSGHSQDGSDNFMLWETHADEVIFLFSNCFLYKAARPWFTGGLLCFKNTVPEISLTSSIL